MIIALFIKEQNISLAFHTVNCGKQQLEFSILKANSPSGFFNQLSCCCLSATVI